jgi:hypothetical protein
MTMVPRDHLLPVQHPSIFFPAQPTLNVMTLDTCDDRTAGAAFEKAQNLTDRYPGSFVNCSNHAQWASWHLPTLYIKSLCAILTTLIIQELDLYSQYAQSRFT